MNKLTTSSTIGNFLAAPNANSAKKAIQASPITVSSGTTVINAEVDNYYITENSGTLQINDPTARPDGSSLVQGDSYAVWIGSGTIQFNGTGTVLQPSRFSVLRRWTGSIWVTPLPVLSDPLAIGSGTWSGSVFSGPQTFSNQVRLSSQNASTGDSAMTRDLSDSRYAFQTVTTGPFTAIVGRRYITENAGTLRINDPTTRPDGSALVAGDSYETLIGSGGIQFNGTGTVFQPSRFSIRRRWTGSAWVTPTPVSHELLTSSGTAVVGGIYVIRTGGLGTLFDPSTRPDGSALVSGDFYQVIISNGTFQFGLTGTTFLPSRFPLYRMWSGISWTTLSSVISDSLSVGAGNWTGSTFVGAQSFSGQVELTNQSATNDMSAMNRQLVFLAAANITDLTSTCSGAAQGTGATARRGGGVLRYVDGDLSNTAVANAIHQINLTTGSLEGPFDFAQGVISFSHRWVLYKKITLSASTNVQQFFILGQTNIATNANGLPTTGNSVGWVLESATSMRLWRCNSGVITYSTSFNPTNVSASTNAMMHHIWLECDGAGTLRLYVVARSTGTGVPPIPTSPQTTISSLPTLSTVGAALCLRATATSPASFSSHGLAEAKLINY